MDVDDLEAAAAGVVEDGGCCSLRMYCFVVLPFPRAAAWWGEVNEVVNRKMGKNIVIFLLRFFRQSFPKRHMWCNFTLKTNGFDRNIRLFPHEVTYFIMRRPNTSIILSLPRALALLTGLGRSGRRSRLLR